MAITVYTIKCPNCSADLPIEKGREKIFCSYCGSQIYVTNENEHIYRRIDETAIKKAEAEKQLKLKQLELIAKERQTQRDSIKQLFKYFAIAGAVGAVMLLIGILAKNFVFGLIGFLIILAFIIASCILWYQYFNLNSNNSSVVAAYGGKIRLPQEAFQYLNKNYAYVEKDFKKAGFTNVKSVGLGDVIIGLMVAEFGVSNITVDGKDINLISPNDRFDTDATIIISYHSRR